jgi:enterochelin esterase family protein
MNLSTLFATVVLYGVAAVVVRSAVPKLVSPEVNPDQTVSVRVYAPHAQRVALSLEGYPLQPMAKDAAGVWSVTSPALEPDFYCYGLLIDGQGFSDPSNPVTRPNLLWPGSTVHVPGPATLPWEVNDVPHGELHRHVYRSAVGRDTRDYWVYTPPGFDPRSNQRYPTLYLLHGYSDRTEAWIEIGRANVILDNLIARHQARPMLVVMPSGYGSNRIIEIGRAGGSMHSGGDAPIADNNRLFQQSLMAELIPRIEKEYPVYSAAFDRAIAGLSMGGGQALLIGLNRPDEFSWIGSFSAGGLTADIPDQFRSARAETAHHPLKLLWMACGRDDSLFPFNEQVRQYLTSQGIHPVNVTTPRAHVWQVWRRNLAEFLPLLFR